MPQAGCCGLCSSIEKGTSAPSRTTCPARRPWSLPPISRGCSVLKPGCRCCEALARRQPRRVFSRTGSPAQEQDPLRRSAQPHIHGLKPRHPAALVFLAVLDGVPMPSSPMGPTGGVAATAAGSITQCCPGARCSSPGLAIGSDAVCLLQADMQGALRMATVKAWLLCRICMISRFHVSAVSCGGTGDGRPAFAGQDIEIKPLELPPKPPGEGTDVQGRCHVSTTGIQVAVD